MDEQSEVHEVKQSENNDNSLPKGYSPKQVKDGVKVLFQILEKTKKKSLFEDEGEYIHMRVTCIRIPKANKKNYRFALPNGFLRETSEVCLFVKDRPADGKDYENTVRHYKDMLAEAGVTCISEVISMSQLMEEYKTYEMRRRLAARYDMFLADSAVSNWLHHALGKIFHSCRKAPTPVKLHPKNLKERLERTLLKSTMAITGGTINSLKVVGGNRFRALWL